MPHPPVTFQSPTLLAVALALTLLCAAVAFFRRAIITRDAAVLIFIGVLMLALAAGQMRWRGSDGDGIAVMVDVSPSTRGASYRDATVLQQRIDQLLGGAPHRIYQFAAQTSPARLDTLHAETSSTQTIFSPPAEADLVLLFSDGQFDPPALAPPVYPVIDPALQRPQDAAVEQLQLRDDRLAITVRNSGPPRNLIITGAAPSTQPVQADRQILSAQLTDRFADVTARLHARDNWLENDALTLRPPPPLERQRWWIGQRAPPDASWHHIAPAQLPVDLAEYLSTGIVALDNVSPDEMQLIHRERLEQYVRELGGGMLILGGDRAFAVGGYPGTFFETLSPLASNPPQPTTHWVLLADSSGSMASRIGDNTRWRFATTAITDLVPILPPDDPLTVGNFAADVRWWQRGRPVADTDLSRLVPNDVRPEGPTNLLPALAQVAQQSDGATPTQLVIITDAETNLSDAEALLPQLTQKRITLHALTTRDVPPDHPLRVLIERTGGRMIAQEDPRRWVNELRQLLRAAAVPWLMRDPVTVNFTERGPSLPDEQTVTWNRTWLKPDATALATAANADNAPMAAAWDYGTGAVIATAYPPSPQTVEALAERVAIPPRDPRFSIDWHIGRQTVVRVDAQENGRHLNDLAMSLDLSDDSTPTSTTHRLAQTAPGRYELALPAPSRPTLAAVKVNGHILDRRAIAARYPAEFDRIGNDLDALTQLAERTGGEVIEPTRTTAIRLKPSTRGLSLASGLAVAGAVFIGAGLIRWRLT